MATVRQKITSCRKRARICRLNAENAESALEEWAWLDMADDWTKLAEAIEQEDQPRWLH
jgi:hypothetical protein